MKNLQKYIIYIVIIIAVVIALIALKNWWRPAIIDALGGYTEKEIISTIDTVKIKVDSILPVYSEKEIRILVPSSNTKEIDIIMNKLKELNDKVEGQQIDSLRYYSYSIEDSILKGHISTVTNTKDGAILKQDFKYTSKVPMYITKTITVEKNTTETLGKSNRVLIGAGIDVTSEKDYGITGFYKTKNNILISGGYMKATEQNRNDYIKLGIGFVF